MISTRKWLWLSAFGILMLVFSGCDVSNSDQFTPEYVVESYLFATEPLPAVRLSRTVAFGQRYDFSEQAVSGANVSLRLLGNGGPDAVFSYGEGAQKGVYLPPDSLAQVLPLRTYQLEVTFADDPTVLRATTLVPDTFTIVQATADTIVFGSTEQLEITISETSYPGRQNIFVFSTQAFDLRFENLTPFFRDILDEEEDDLEDFRIIESPPVNEENYDRNPDGSLTIKLPWIAVNFFGPNRISANALDDNIFNYITSQELQNNPSTLSPGEIPNIIDPIEGGVGIFGSYARVTKDIYIARPD